jgi:hypothetical protein
MDMIYLKPILNTSFPSVLDVSGCRVKETVRPYRPVDGKLELKKTAENAECTRLLAPNGWETSRFSFVSSLVDSLIKG